MRLILEIAIGIVFGQTLLDILGAAMSYSGKLVGQLFNRAVEKQVKARVSARPIVRESGHQIEDLERQQ